MEISNLSRKRISSYLREGKRFDGRKLHDLREIEIETNISKNAEGSARVKIGDTEVIAGVKLDVVEPYPDNEDEGTLVTSAELLPLSSPRFEAGPPKIEAIELARVVDRGIRESNFIDFKKLCIKKGEKVWGIFIDIYTINDDGNLIDASCLAAVTALKTAKMPKYDEKKESINHDELTNKPLPLSESIPINLTFFKIGESIIVDPVREEEDSSDARLSLALTKDKEIMINSIQKGNEEPLSEEEISNILEIATEKFKLLEKKIKEEIGKLLKTKSK